MKLNPSQSPSRRLGARTFIGAFAVAWLAAVLVCASVLLRRDTTPGAPAKLSLASANLLPVAISADRPTLVMVLHPNCPCSRASVAELAELTSAHSHQFHTIIVMYHPAGLKPDPATADLATTAAAIPDATLINDTGAIVHSLGARTSGQVYVYSPKGTLLFSGGITASRGHIGENDGQAAVADLIEHGTSPESSVRTTPVFGCRLD